MDNSLFFVPIVCGSIFLILGFVLYKFPPKRINILYGYRTKSSMRDQESWDFAQRYSAKVSIKGGAVYTLSAILGLFYNPGELAGALIGFGGSLIVVAYLFFKVEKAISARFKTASHA